MKDAVDLAAKTGAVLALVSYVLGLLVVQTYLYTIHVSLADPGVLKVRFIYSGAITLALLCLLCLLPAWAFGFAGYVPKPKAQKNTSHDSNTDTRPGENRTRHSAGRPALGKRIGAISASISVPFLLLALLVYKTPGGVSRSDLIDRTIALYMFALVAGASAFLAVATAAGLFEAKLPRWMGVLAFTVFSIVMLLAYAFAVGNWIYATLPDQFGGERPHHTCLVLKPDAATEAEALGLRPTNGQDVPVRVLFDGTDFLVIRRVDRVVVEFDKSLLAGSSHASPC
jgi:hypothetical protein